MPISTLESITCRLTSTHKIYASTLAYNFSGTRTIEPSSKKAGVFMAHSIQIAAQAGSPTGSNILAKALVEALTGRPSAPSGPHEAVAHSNPAVAACSVAYRQAHEKARAAGKASYEVTSAAREAFRRAMPALDSPANITDFIACVAHGLLIEVISDSDSARLLYAAQVASSAARLHTRSSGRPPKVAPEPPASENTHAKNTDPAELTPLLENQ
jgi:hypothetical protein